MKSCTCACPIADLGECADIDFEDWVGVAEAFTDGQVQLFPNPANSVVELVIDRPGAHDVRVLDVEGRQHMAWTTTDLVERVDVRGLTSGMYFVELTQGNATACDASCGAVICQDPKT